MAYSIKQWEKAKEYFEAGLSLSEINLRTEISRPQISKKAKKENWEKGNIKKHIISQAVEVAQVKETLNETALEVHKELVTDELRRKNLVYGASEKLLQRTQQMIEANRTVEKVNIGDGVQQFEPRDLNSSDLKNLADTIDKTSVTLKVNDRFSNNQVQVNNQNNQVSEIIISEA